MTPFDEPKVDCHNHIFDPARFPYIADAWYRPLPQETGTAADFLNVLDAHGVRHALLVGPNSGYGEDNRYLIDTIARSDGRFKGVAVVPNDIGEAALRELKAAGVVGVTFNVALLGVSHYADTAGLLATLARLDLYVQVQVEHDQLVPLAAMLERSGAGILIDHCGRPTPEAGIHQPGFRSVLALARSGRASVKLSGQVKFSRDEYPYADTWPFVRALIDAYTLDHCVWGSDWPFLRARHRVDYGPLLKLVEILVPDTAHRRKIMWETPMRLFGF
jgi:predicted TIM-barrel fold metal-dependent hydrolase